MARVELRESNTIRRELIKVRRLDLGLPVAAEFVVTKIIREEVNDVRR